MEDFWEGFEKRAGFRDFVKNTLLSGAMVGSIPMGFHVGGTGGQVLGGILGSAKFTNLISHAPRIDSAKFVNKYAPQMGYKPGVAGAAEHFRAAKVNNPEGVAKGFMEASGGSPYHSRLTNKIIADNMAEPSSLAHELGHHNIRSNVDPSLMNTLKGGVLKDESNAWQWAKNKGIHVDPKIEDAALSSYTGSRYGAMGGAAAGSSGGLLSASAAARALAENLKRKALQKSKNVPVGKA